MLAKVPRSADQLARQLQREGEARIGAVEAELLDMAVLHPLVGPAPDLAGEGCGQILREAQRLADLADGAAGAVAGDDGGERGAMMAVGLVDRLDDLLAPLMLEI